MSRKRTIIGGKIAPRIYKRGHWKVEYTVRGRTYIETVGSFFHACHLAKQVREELGSGWSFQ